MDRPLSLQTIDHNTSPSPANYFILFIRHCPGRNSRSLSLIRAEDTRRQSYRSDLDQLYDRLLTCNSIVRHRIGSLTLPLNLFLREHLILSLELIPLQERTSILRLLETSVTWIGRGIHFKIRISCCRSCFLFFKVKKKR